ncbi:MAG: TolC family protein [Planctomycetes bacterium]|nr:TolC family protein [Planctomycetota bacterium]
MSPELRVRFSAPRAGLLAMGSILLAACESYEAAPVELRSIGPELAQLEVPAELDLEGALRFAEERDPELRRRAHEARAALLDVPGFELMYSMGTRDGMADLTIDPAELFGLLQRGAAFDSAEAERALLVAEWAEARWRLGTELAAIYLAAERLEQLRAPRFDVDERAFERAGLASPNAVARLRSARLAVELEQQEIAAERERLRARFARRLGVPRERAPRMRFEVQAAGEFQAEAQVAVDFAARPDLRVAEARYLRAEAALYEAAAAQYPRLRLGPEWMIGSSSWGGMFQVYLPLDAGGPVRAARARREAARAELDATWLAAEEELRLLEQDLALASARTRQLEEATRAAELALQSARAELELGAGAFEMVAERAAMVVREAGERRMAQLREAELLARAGARGGAVPYARERAELVAEGRP